MTEECPIKKSHGGARAGAGRKPDAEKKVAVEIRLTEKERAQLRALGGSSWIRQELKRISSALDKMNLPG